MFLLLFKHSLDFSTNSAVLKLGVYNSDPLETIQVDPFLVAITGMVEIYKNSA